MHIPSREELFSETCAMLEEYLSPQAKADLSELVSDLLFIAETGDRTKAARAVDDAIRLMEALTIDKSDLMQLKPDQSDAIANMWKGTHERGETI